MKNYSLLLLLYLSILQCVAQTNVQENKWEKHFQQAFQIAKTTKSMDSLFYHLQRAENELQTSKDWYVFGDSINTMGKWLKDKDFFPEAFQLFHTYLPIIEECLGREQEVIAKMYAYLGDAYQKQGRFEDAANYFDQALPIFDALGKEDTFVAHILRFRAGICSQTGNNPKAISLLKNALKIYKNYHHVSGQIRTLINLGATSNNLWEALEDSIAHKQSLQNYQKAIQLIDEQLKNKKENRSLQLLKANTLVNIGDALDQNDTLDQVGAYLFRAYDLFQQLDSKWHLGRAQEVIANYYEKKADTSQALQYYQISLKQLEEFYQTKHHRDIARIYCRMANIYFEQQLFSKSLGNYQKALNVLLPSFQDSLPTMHPNSDLFYHEPWIMETLAGKAEVFQQLYQTNNQSIEHLRHALQCSELAFEMAELLHRMYDRDSPKHFISEFIHETYETAIQVSLALYKETKEMQYFEKAFAFSEQSKASILREVINDLTAKNFSQIPIELLQKELDLKAELALLEKQLYDAQITQDTTEIKRVEMALYSQRKQLNQWVGELEEDYPDYYNLKYKSTTISLQNLQQRLTEHQALIEYFLGEQTVYCFVITSNGIQRHSFPIPEDFSVVVKEFRQAAGAKEEKRNDSIQEVYVKRAYQLYELLLKISLKELPSKAIQQLTIIPDGVLGYIPFDILLCDSIESHELHSSQSYLLQKYSISYAYSATLLFQDIMNQTFSHSFGGFGPVYAEKDLAILNREDTIDIEQPEIYASLSREGGDKLRDLESAREAVMDISILLEGDKWLEEAASEKNFKELAANYGILHLAMHGLVNDKNPLYSSLVFTLNADTLEDDNFLTAAEIYNLQLNAGLAVLSACQTGEGKFKRGEGIMSLARAFAYAGCPSMVMSLWSVPDKETGELMIYFYEELKGGKTKDVALQQAKLRYLEGHKENRVKTYPYHWAAFVPIGDMQAMQIERGVKWWMWLVIAFIFLIGIKKMKQYRQLYFPPLKSIT